MASEYSQDKRAIILWVGSILGAILTASTIALFGFVVGLNSRVAVLESQSSTFRDAISQMNGKLDALLIQSSHK